MSWDNSSLESAASSVVFSRLILPGDLCHWWVLRYPIRLPDCSAQPMIDQLKFCHTYFIGHLWNGAQTSNWPNHIYLINQLHLNEIQLVLCQEYYVNWKKTVRFLLFLQISSSSSLQLLNKCCKRSSSQPAVFDQKVCTDSILTSSLLAVQQLSNFLRQPPPWWIGPMFLLITMLLLGNKLREYMPN